VPPRLITWLLALAGAGLVLYMGTPTEDVYWSDFNAEAWPAFERLIAGDLSGFLSLAPLGYGGSMVLRAPFGAVAGWLGFEQPGLYRLITLPSLFALAALAVHLAGRARAAHPEGRWWLLVLALAGASPLAGQAVWYGHSEELLTTALAVAAVLAALRDRTIVAGVLLGAAIACKQWAVIAVLPTVLAAPRGHMRMLAAAGGTGAALLAPILLADPGAFAAAQKGVVSSAQWFRPRQLWWPFGAAPPPGPDVPPGAAVTPSWLAPIAKPLIVGLTIPLSALWAHRRRGPRTDALLLLALLLLVRCVLDPWNVLYYHLPLVVALLAWEVLDGRRIPVLSLATTGAVWLTFSTYDTAYSDGPWLAYLAWTLPLAAHLSWRLYRPALPRLAQPVPAPARA
jgi:hypothetical protein